MLISIIFFLVSPDESPSQKRWTEEKTAVATTTRDAEKIPDVQETSKNSAGARGPVSQEIPTGEPIVPPLPPYIKLPVARLLYTDEPIGTPEEIAEEEESGNDLIREIRASPPPCEYNYDEDLGDDPQLTLGNLKKLQANIREFSRFTVVRTKSSSVFFYV